MSRRTYARIVYGFIGLYAVLAIVPIFTGLHPVVQSLSRMAFMAFLLVHLAHEREEDR